VSHDRYFLDGLATKVLEVGNGTAITYLGNYEDYLEKKKVEQDAVQEPEVRIPAASKPSEEPPRDRTRRKVNPYKIQELTGRIAKVESAIQTHETRIAVLARMLSTEELYRDYILFRETMAEHERLQRELDQYMAEWEELQTALKVLQS
jgi:ATP-binding cassette subfamily F protein 3